MPKPKLVLSRRAFLAGAGSTVVALPLLEAMSGARARGQSIESPKRFLVAFVGSSTGTYDNRDSVVPATIGPGYEITRGLAPLGMDSLASEVSIVSGLRFPIGGAGGWSGVDNDWHASFVALLTGRHQTSGFDTDSPSSDQVVAGTIAGDTRIRTLELRVQAASYRGGDGKGRISYDLDGTSRPPIGSPRIAYETLFRGFTPTDGADAERERLALEEDRSVVDLVRQSADRLNARLGRYDQVRLERHFDEIRDLERRLASIAPVAMGACMIPPDPGADPPIEMLGGGGGTTDETGYAQEEERATVMVDLIHLAFACDLTRVVSLMITFAQSFMNVQPLTGVYTDLHNLSHGGGDRDDMADAIAWHVKHWSRLVGKLRDTPDGDGTLLDHSALALVMEGGHHETEWSHSGDNMCALIAGRAGGLSPGRHVVAAGMHPARVLISAMRAVGHSDERLGEITGSIPTLFTA